MTPQNIEIKRAPLKNDFRGAFFYIFRHFVGVQPEFCRKTLVK